MEDSVGRVSAQPYSYLKDYEENRGEWESASFRDRNRIGRMREVLDKKGVSDFLKEMYRDCWEELDNLLSVSAEEEVIPDDSLQKFIRRLKCARVNEKKSSPKMYGCILGKMGNKRETFIADTGTSISVHPINLTRKNGIKWREEDPDKLKYLGVTGTDLTILGQADIKVAFNTLKNTKHLRKMI